MLQHWRLTLVVTAIAATSFFAALGSIRLWDEDEPKNAVCGHEMFARSDWVVPTFNDQLRTDKPILIRTAQIVIFLVSGLTVAILTYVINYTKIGKALQAVAEDPMTASLLGINPEQYIVLTFFLSGFLGGMAGALVGTSVSIAGPYFGITFGLKGLGVIVLGGLGNIPGAVMGGLVIGLAESFVPSEYSGYREAISFTLLFLMLLIRPQGLFGRSQTAKV